MLIGLIADTHDNLPRIARAVRYFNDEGTDLVLHAGDIISPFCAAELEKLKCRVIAVFGNNDGERQGWRGRIRNFGEIHDGPAELEFEGKTILLMHEPQDLEQRVAAQSFDVVVYGHTHAVDNRTSGRTLVVNPGECGAWLSGKSTVALLRLPQKEVRIVELPQR